MYAPAEVRATITPLVIRKPPLVFNAALAELVKSSVKSTADVSVFLQLLKQEATAIPPAEMPSIERNSFLFMEYV